MADWRDIHVDKLLSNISIQYQNEMFVGELIFPRLGVKQDSGKYTVYGQEQFSTPETKVADKTPTKQVEWSVTQASYECEDYGLHDLVSDKMKRNVDNPVQLRVQTTENITKILKLAREKRVLDIVFSASTITQTVALTGDDQWSAKTTSDPIDDIDTGKETIKKAVGVNPNTLVLSEDVFNKLKNHPAFTEKIKYSMKGILTAELIAEVVGVGKCLVAGAVYNTANEGQTVDKDWLYTKVALLCFIAPTLGLNVMSLGATISSKLPVVSGWREPTKRSDAIEVIETTDEKLIAAACGYLITGAIA